MDVYKESSIWDTKYSTFYLLKKKKFKIVINSKKIICIKSVTLIFKPSLPVIYYLKPICIMS